MSKTIYDAIIGIIVIILLLSKFVLPLISKAIVSINEKAGIKCSNCKYKMQDIAKYLYLIPACLDEKHEESAEYYIKNAKPIQSTEQIPSADRACYMYIFQCPNCGSKKVSVVDFLKVRDVEILKGGDIYPYEKFQEFFYQNTLQ